MWEFISDCLSRHATSTIYDDVSKFTYCEIAIAARVHGANLKTRLPSRSKCAILCESGLNTAIAILACWYAGMIPIPMSIYYGDKNCQGILSLTTPALVIIDDVGASTYFSTYNIQNRKFSGELKYTNNSEEMEDIAVIMCTSGTTGMPKGALITCAGLKQNVLAIGDYFKIHSKDIILIARPLYHCAVLTGEFLTSLYKGVNIVFYDQQYEPKSIIDRIRRKGVTIMCGTPSLFKHMSLVYQQRKELSPIKTMALSGECLTLQTAQKIRSVFRNTDIYNVYGLTEASPRVSFLPPDLFDLYPESVGIPLKNTQVKIVDITSGSEIPPKEKGLILVKSPSIMKGYYRNENLTSATLRDGWLNTHDVGYKDERGFLYILSRDDNMIIKGGMNIYPKEIENEIYRFPEIKEVVAYGVKNDTTEDIVVDIVLYNDYSHITAKEILKKLALVLPAYLIPNQIHIVESLEKNASGKIVRKK